MKNDEAMSTDDLPLKQAPVRESRHTAWMAGAFLTLLAFLAILAWALRNEQKGPIQVGQPAPDFSMTLYDGGVFDTSQTAEKVLLINFWASWCKPCEQEAAELEEAWRTFRDEEGVIFLGVDYVDTESEARAYLEKFHITYPNGPDLRTNISQLYRTTGVPETYIIDRDGHLAFIKVGPFNSLAEIHAVLAPLVEQ